jgi:hypothetical protein
MYQLSTEFCIISLHDISACPQVSTPKVIINTSDEVRAAEGGGGSTL